MTDDEFADRIRSMIEHENTMRDQRLNWLNASQGFLIAALNFSWGKDKYLVISLATIGLLLCISIGVSLYCNTLAIWRLADSWHMHSPKYQGPDVIGLRSSKIKPRFFTYLYPWNVIPISLSIFWLFCIRYVMLK